MKTSIAKQPSQAKVEANNVYATLSHFDPQWNFAYHTKGITVSSLLVTHFSIRFVHYTLVPPFSSWNILVPCFLMLYYLLQARWTGPQSSITRLRHVNHDLPTLCNGHLPS